MNESAKYCAFLRGVNVNGTTMKMVDVCNVFSKAGVENVSSVLASGNILFQSNKSVSELKTSLENAMSKAFIYEAFLFIKDASEISKIVANFPFEKKDDFHQYVFVTSSGIEDVLMDEFEKSKKAEEEEAKIINSTFYWKMKKGDTLNSSFGKILGRKNLKDKITSRNANTFEKILKKLQA